MYVCMHAYMHACMRACTQACSLSPHRSSRSAAGGCAARTCAADTNVLPPIVRWWGDTVLLSLRGGTGGQLRPSPSPLGARDEQEGPSMAQAACDETHSDDSNADVSAGKIAEKKQKPCLKIGEMQSRAATHDLGSSSPLKPLPPSLEEFKEALEKAGVHGLGDSLSSTLMSALIKQEADACSTHQKSDTPNNDGFVAHGLEVALFTPLHPLSM